MGGALVGGLVDAGYEAEGIAIAEVDADRRRELEQRFPKVRVVPSAAWAVADADVVIVAVKPGDVPDTLESARPALGDDTLVLSIEAGVTIATLEALAPGRPVVRAMPNTPALVGRGASAISPASSLCTSAWTRKTRSASASPACSTTSARSRCRRTCSTSRARSRATSSCA